MSRRRTLTDKMVAKMKAPAKRRADPDPELSGHYVDRQTTGAKSYKCQARDPSGKQVWSTIGPTDHFKIEDARDAARERIRRIKAGLPPVEPAPALPESFKGVAKSYLERHVRKNKLRSEAEIERVLTKYVYPKWQDRQFTSIRRGDVTALLDTIEDDNGASQADHVLSTVRGIMNWYATRADDYEPPIVRGMRRTSPKARQRRRVLGDDEIRLIWRVAEGNGTFGAILRMALLTAQRREKLATMRWQDVTIDGTWNIQADEREKGTAGALVLPELALQIIRAQDRIEGNPYVFAGRGEGPFAGWSPCKRAFDAKVLKAAQDAARDRGEDPRKVRLEPWVIHDLRRTARSLMARSGVHKDIAERVLGHVQGDMVETYDRHTYTQEKADALRRLAGLLAVILKPPGGKVVALAEARG